MDSARLWTLGAACLGGLVLGVIGAGIVLIAGYLRNRAARSQQWPSTLGQVLTSGVREIATDDGRFDWPNVTYQYAVGARTYTSNRVSFGPASAFGGYTAQNVQARYPVGQAVTVYYDPGNPSEAVLERREHASRAYLIIALIVFLLALCFPPLAALAGIAAMGQ
ncbi:MAG: DUF3592 domain-containing protein [Anaerolineales bacterium]|nr:DUF3592 domain-containing protein [Anaerolineales bacterium]